jgi:hypothetical protein
VYAQLAIENPEETIELSGDEYNDYKRVMDEFYKWQERFAAYR